MIQLLGASLFKQSPHFFSRLQLHFMVQIAHDSRTKIISTLNTGQRRDSSWLFCFRIGRNIHITNQIKSRCRFGPASFPRDDYLAITHTQRKNNIY